ncbi:MAG: hypothetical protein IPM34_10510 [Saprospiraceae bacterium]|nr:hypothetical protein [Saprospiraceae bacterium]
MRKYATAILILSFYTHTNLQTDSVDWGFFGHKLINRLAIFTLPSDLITFYKKNIEYITSHSVDPDKRRYTVKAEAIRHYIDLDHWLHKPVDSLPSDYALALLKFESFYILSDADTLLLFETNKVVPNLSSFYGKQDSLYFSKQIVELLEPEHCAISIKLFQKLFYNHILQEYDPDAWNVDLTILQDYFIQKVTPDYRLSIIDTFSKHGILPYHFTRVYKQLIQAFEEKDHPKILRLSADIGHYLGDAHVPLHTSKNYNGQLTNQTGIHAFWESRIPELFAEQDFDFVVGPAFFIEDINRFIWNILYESHSFVPALLEKEKTLSQTYPFDKQYCFETRGSTTVKLPCKKYAERYYKSLDDQVEQRMRACIRNLGSVWLSAWIEAGQPDLSEEFEVSKESKTIATDSTALELVTPQRVHE